MFCMVFALFGIPLNLMVLRHIGDRVNHLISYVHFLVETKLLKREEQQVATKTLMWTLLVLIVMLFVGAFLYLQKEQWNFLEGVYFCFITFSTIGFGDLVPNGGEEERIYFYLFNYLRKSRCCGCSLWPVHELSLQARERWARKVFPGPPLTFRLFQMSCG